MGMYVHIMTAKQTAEGYSDPAEIGDILGFTQADVAIVEAIEAHYRPILNDQMREDWSERYAEYVGKLSATPALTIASTYGSMGFGKVRWAGANALTKNGGGECHGLDAIAALDAQRAKFPDPDCQEMQLAINRAITAVRDGRVTGVCWF